MNTLDPKKTAVIVLDIQNDFCDDQGAFAKFLGWKTEGIETIIVTGLYTEVCVFGTVERAFTEGYRVVVSKDLVGSTDERLQLQNASLEIMANYLADVVDSGQILTLYDFCK